MTDLFALPVASVLWYVTRGSGVVALLLLTASFVLGIVVSTRWERPVWPRLVTGTLHRTVSLLAVVFLALHVVTTVADGYAPITWLDVVVPFVSEYEPFWLGLGTVALDLFVALIVTSLLRTRLGLRTWRVVHWAAYACWPVAVAHTVGIGTDMGELWLRAVTGACVLAALVAVGWRLRRRTPALPVTGPVPGARPGSERARTPR